MFLLIVVMLAQPFAGGAPPTGAPTTLDWSVSGPRSVVLTPQPAGSLDSVRVFQPTVVRAFNGSYLMYYTGYDGFRDRVLGAFSTDGITWTRLAGDIFLNDGAASPFLMTDGAGFRMFFESVVWGVGPLGYTDRIYGATSTDGLSWSLTGVALDVGNASALDAASVADPSVVRGPGGVYLMYYTMYAADGSVAIGVASSTDLVSFTRWSGNPVLPRGTAGAWDSAAVSNPSAVAGPPWVLFYSGGNLSAGGLIGLATSSDGYHWTRPSAPFLGHDAPGTWDSSGVGAPSFLDGSPARLYFDGSNGNGTNAIGMVTLVGSPPSGAPSGITILGMSLADVLILASVVAVGAVALSIAAIVMRRESRLRPP